MISKSMAQRRLLILWVISGLLLFIIMIARTVGGLYGSKVNDAWSWFLPTILPTLSLMVTVATTQQTMNQKSSKMLYQMAFALSFFYQLLVLFAILNPIPNTYTPTEMMRTSNLWLGPVQGLVAALLGVFFVKSK